MKRIQNLSIGFVIVFIILIFWGPQSTLDKKFFYTGEYAKDFLYSLDEAQVARYLTNEWIDLGFIAIYTSLFLRVCRWFKLPHALFFLSFVPGFFDLLETTFIISILTGFYHPYSMDGLGYFTAMKWCSTALLTLFFLCLLVFYRRKSDQARR